MKCPYCEYEDGYDVEKNKEVHGKEEGFWSLPVKMEREHPRDYTREQAVLLACPACKKVFVDKIF